jgi:hypothetical protein
MLRFSIAEPTRIPILEQLVGWGVNRLFSPISRALLFQLNAHKTRSDLTLKAFNKKTGKFFSIAENVSKPDCWTGILGRRPVKMGCGRLPASVL